MSNAHRFLYHYLKHCRQLITAGMFILSIAVISPAAIALELDEAVNKVQTELGGKVLDIQRVTVQHSPAFRIKLLQPSGRIKVLLLDAATGEFLADASAPHKKPK